MAGPALLPPPPPSAFSGDDDLARFVAAADAGPGPASGCAPLANAFLKSESMPSLRCATGCTNDAESLPTLLTSCGTA